MNTNDFKAFCAKAKKIVKANNTILALDFIKFSQNKATVSNLDIFIEIKVEKHFEEDIYINFKDFDKIVSKCKNSPIDITKEEGIVFVKTNKGDFTFTDSNLVFSKDGESQFPIIKDSFLETVSVISKSDIQLIKKAVGYTGDNELIPKMTYVFIDNKHIVGTDSHLLGKYEREVEQDFAFMLPKKLVPILDENEYNVSHTEDIRRCLIEDGLFSYHFRTSDEKYVNYNVVIPSANSTKTFFEIKSKDLLDICDSALIVSDKDGCGQTVKLNIDTEKKEIFLSVENIHLGKSFNKTFSCDMDGHNISIGFNIYKLIKMIKNEKREDLIFMLTEPNNPALINEEVILMSMKINL